MGCVEASAYTTGTILGTHSSLEDCEQQCGVCCIPGCETDFAAISACTATPELLPDNYDFCNQYGDENGYPYIDTNYKKLCYSGTVGFSGPWTYETQYGWCPANHVGGCFEGNFDCSSERILSSGNKVSYATRSANNPEAFISGGNPGSATAADPCGGSYPCTKLWEQSNFSSILIQKNPGWYYNISDYKVGRFRPKDDLSWDSSYLFALFDYEFNAGCINGTGNMDWGINGDIFSSEGSYINYLPACCSGVIDPDGTSKDKVFIFRIKGSYKRIVTYDNGPFDVTFGPYDYVPGTDPAQYTLSNSSDNWLGALCQTCNVASDPSAGGIHVSDIQDIYSRSHDVQIYLCDPSTSTMTDMSSYICQKNIPFFVPTPFDTIDWVNDEGYSSYTVDNFSSIVGTVWGMHPIVYQTEYNECQNTNPCGTRVVGEGYCPPCDPYNFIAGNFRESDATLYITRTPTSFTYAQTGTFSPYPVEFQEIPDITSVVSVNYSCNDTISQSGCSDQVSAVWHSGQNCTTFDCNA